MSGQYGVLRMEVPLELAERLKDLFDIEVEMMQGEIEKIRNNVYRFTIKVPLEKGTKIKNYLLETISHSKGKNMN